MERNKEAGRAEKKIIRIAVVDDNEDIVELLGEVLKQSDYSSDLFTVSKDALLASTSQEYDIVITDLEMPEVTGIELLARVKKVFPLTQFIMITGYASVKSAAEAMHRGAVSYLTKPLTSTQIMAHVEKALEKRSLSLENERLIFELTGANEALQNKVQELEHLNDLLSQTQEDLVKVERLAAIGQVVVSINHSINNSIAGIKAAVHVMRNSANLDPEIAGSLDKVDAECNEVEAVVARLKSLRQAAPEEYVDGVKMIGLKEERIDATV
ncbi:MAG: response regulator [Candidatus Eisenbacteria bacterium]